MINEEDYVNFEVAKKLREKGFRELCCRFYRKGGSCDGSPWRFDYNKDLGRYSRPTLYEAQKWLREKHNIHLDVRCTAYSKKLERVDYQCEIYKMDSFKYSETKIYHKYEEALNEGILKALKLI